MNKQRTSTLLDSFVFPSILFFSIFFSLSHRLSVVQSTTWHSPVSWHELFPIFFFVFRCLFLSLYYVQLALLWANLLTLFSRYGLMLHKSVDIDEVLDLWCASFIFSGWRCVDVGLEWAWHVRYRRHQQRPFCQGVDWSAHSTWQSSPPNRYRLWSWSFVFASCSTATRRVIQN